MDWLGLGTASDKPAFPQTVLTPNSNANSHPRMNLASPNAEHLVGLREDAKVVNVFLRNREKALEDGRADGEPPRRIGDRLKEHRDPGAAYRLRSAFHIGNRGGLVDEDLHVRLTAGEGEKCAMLLPKRA